VAPGLAGGGKRGELRRSSASARHGGGVGAAAG